MNRWLLAAGLAVVGAWVAYWPLWRSGGATDSPLSRPVARGASALLLSGLRAAAYALLLAMLFGAPAGAPEPLAPLAVLDASVSWSRADDGRGWRSALDSLASLSGDSVLLTGDSSRLVSRSDPTLGAPRDQRSALQPAIDQATALGRAIALITDGELDDSGALQRLPAGSRVVRIDRALRPDLAVSSIDLPSVATGGDTVELSATLVAGNATVESGVLSVLLDNDAIQSVPLQSVPAFASRRVAVRIPLPRGAAQRTLTAVVSGANDVESRNDTLVASLDVTDRPRVVFVSTAPDLDVREALRVMRGTVMLPARAYLRLAPGIWREEGTLAPIAESVVQERAREAGLLVLHGDTTWSGIAGSRRGAALLWAPAPPPSAPRAGELGREVEWFASRAPTSPLSGVLNALPFDSLSPLDLGPAVEGGVPLLEARAGGRSITRTVAAITSANGARQVRLAGSGFAGWTLREGRGDDAFTALWGAIFDWLAVAEGDGEGAFLAGNMLRAGEPLRWRRGSGDSVQTVFVSTASGSGESRTVSSAVDTLTLRFAPESDVLETAPLAAGQYDVRNGARSQRVIVNPSREWVPQPPAESPMVSAAGASSVGARPLLERTWPFVLALVLLSLEWFARRFVGLR